ncbi:MAG: hypothetical protein AAGF01_24885 [Cyanobacteria bacterium P01_G01_bin.38]
MPSSLPKLMTWAITLSSLGMIGIWQLRVNLAPCQPLDQRLQRSGCFQTLLVDPKALGSPHFLLRSFQANVHDFAFSPEGDLIALPGSVLRSDDAGRDKAGLAIALLETDTGATRQSFSVDETYYTTEAPGKITPMRGEFSPNGHFFAAHIQHNGLLKATYLWEVASGHQVWKVNGYLCDRMIFAPDGQHVLCEERRIRVSDGAVLNLTEQNLQTLAVQSPIDELISPYRYEVTAPDRTFRAVLQLAVDDYCQSDCRYVEIQPLGHQSTSENVRLTLSSSTAVPQALYVSPDSRVIAIQTSVNDAPLISIWRRDGVLLRQFKLSDRISGIQWSPDSRTLAVWLNQTVQLYNAEHLKSTSTQELSFDRSVFEHNPIAWLTLF